MPLELGQDLADLERPGDRAVREVHLHLAGRVGHDRYDDVAVPFARFVSPRSEAGDASMPLTFTFGVGASATVTFPAGTWIGPEHCPTRTFDGVVAPRRSVR